MSTSTSGPGPDGPARHRAEEGPQDPASPDAPRRTRRWLLIGAGALIAIGAVVAVLVLGNQDTPPGVPEAEVITLPPLTPTLEPVEREPGTAYFDALPDVVLAWALTEAGEHTPFLPQGAVEAYRLVYEDGGAEPIVLLTGQWPTAEAAAAAFDRVLAEQADAIAAAGGDQDEAAEQDEADVQDEADGEVEQGAVTVDGGEVGRYLLLPRADGTGTAWWTNGTVLIQVDGPAEELRSFYAAFPL